jgi:hypothetical protein
VVCVSRLLIRHVRDTQLLVLHSILLGTEVPLARVQIQAQTFCDIIDASHVVLVQLLAMYSEYGRVPHPSELPTSRQNSKIEHCFYRIARNISNTCVGTAGHVFLENNSLRKLLEKRKKGGAVSKSNEMTATIANFETFQHSNFATSSVTTSKQYDVTISALSINQSYNISTN